MKNLKELIEMFTKQGKGFSCTMPKDAAEAEKWANESILEDAIRLVEKTERISTLKKEIPLSLLNSCETYIVLSKSTTINKGSEKQISWAKSLRKNITSKMESQYKNALKRKDSEDDKLAIREGLLNFIKIWGECSYDDAEFYINQR